MGDEPMKKLLLAGVLMAVCAGVDARDQGVINQAGPYEATMRFYLHPAHGFPGKAEATPRARLADADESHAQAARDAASRGASAAADPEHPRVDRVATRDPR
jgi:hypothetical protein